MKYTYVLVDKHGEPIAAYSDKQLARVMRETVRAMGAVAYIETVPLNPTEPIKDGEVVYFE